MSERDEYQPAEQAAERERVAAARHAEVMGALRHIFKKLDALEKRLAARANAPAGPPADAGGGVASAADLDGPHGNPTIKYDPKEKYWQGESFVGYHFSETSPEYLDAMARYLDACAFMGAKDEDEKKRKAASYKARDAARARGWAARLRAGGARAAAPAPAQANGAPPAAPARGADEVMF